LQVFAMNEGAIALYESLGFGVQSISMVKGISGGISPRVEK
jgi:ribosomal protein S18 acetylase RimI-like enzyme